MRGIYARLAHVRPLFALASDKVEREDGPLAYGETAGYVRFALSTSGYGYSPPSCSGKRQSRARRRLLEIISYFKSESSVDKEYGEKALLKKMKKRIATPL